MKRLVVAAAATVSVLAMSALGFVTASADQSHDPTLVRCVKPVGVAGYSQNFDQTFSTQAAPTAVGDPQNGAAEKVSLSGTKLIAYEEQSQSEYETSAAVVLSGIPLADFLNPNFSVTIAGANGTTDLAINAWFGPAGAALGANGAAMYADGYEALATQGPQVVRGSTGLTSLSAANYASLRAAAKAMPSDDVYFWIGADIEPGFTPNDGDKFVANAVFTWATRTALCISPSPSPSATPSPSSSPSPQPTASAGPTPSPTPKTSTTGSQPGLPDTGRPAGS